MKGLDSFCKRCSLETPKNSLHSCLHLLLPGWMDNAQSSGHARSTNVSLMWHLPWWGWILLKVNEILCIVQCNHCSVQQAAQHNRKLGFIFQSCSLIALLWVRKNSTELPRMDSSAMLLFQAFLDLPGLPLSRRGGRRYPVIDMNFITNGTEKPLRAGVFWTHREAWIWNLQSRPGCHKLTIFHEWIVLYWASHSNA